ncbi:head-tail connector protein [Streptomyces lavendulocolor]
MPYDLGDVVPLGTTVRDAAGALANAGAMTLTITLPDATTVVVSPVTPASTGIYAYDYPTAQAGRHTVRWVASGINAGAYTDSFDVREASPPAILSLADAKRHLKKTGTDDDDEIRSWVESITAGIETLCGAVIVRTVTERYDVRRTATIALRTTPVLSIISVTPVLTAGTAYVVDDLDVDEDTGIVQRLDGGSMTGPLRVTYTVGRRVVPAALTSAARIILQHLWRTRQGPARPQRGVDDYDVTEPAAGFGYAIPNRALQLMEPYRLPPGVG